MQRGDYKLQGNCFGRKLEGSLPPSRSGQRGPACDHAGPYLFEERVWAEKLGLASNFKVAISERSFGRHYAEATKQTPARAIERLRLEAARTSSFRNTAAVETDRATLRLRLGRNNAPQLSSPNRHHSTRLSRPVRLLNVCYWPIASARAVSLHVGSQEQTGSLLLGASSAACGPRADIGE